MKPITAPSRSRLATSRAATQFRNAFQNVLAALSVSESKEDQQAIAELLGNVEQTFDRAKYATSRNGERFR